MTINIHTKDRELKNKIGMSICEQLAGNYDFVENNIIVNYDDDHVHILIDEILFTNPTVIIDLD